MKRFLFSVVACLLVLLGAVTPARAVTWYVDAAAGSDSNPGTASQPFATLNKLETVMVSGDDALLSGTFRESVTFSDLSGCTWAQWPGRDKYVIRGDTVITGFSASGGGYTKTLATGLNIKSVVVNWDSSVNANGLHYGHLTLAADAATALATTNNWFYNSGTGVLSINTGANPATQTVAWCVGGVNGFTLGNATDCVVDNFKAALWVDSTAGTGYGFFGYGTGNTLRIDRIDDSGYHHAGWVGGVCSSNVIEPSKNGEGVCAGSNTGGIQLVFYTASNSQSGNEARDLTLICSPFLRRDGSTPTHSGTIGGAYSHTDGARVFDGVTWRRIRVKYPYTVGVNSCGFDAGHTTRVTSANEENADNYGVKVIDCRIEGAGAPGLNLNSSIAYVRCSFNFAGAASKSQSTGVLYSTASGVARTALMDACEVMFNLGDSGSTAAVFVRGWTRDRWVFLNCSFAEYGTGTNERRFFAPVGSSASIKAKQCIFAYCTSTATFRRFYNGDNYNNATVSNGVESLAPRVFEDCSYIRIVDTVWSTFADYNTQAEWVSAAMDAGGQASTTNPFEEQTYSARLKRSHALWTYRDTGTSGHTALGINKKLWTGTLGAYQLNASATPTWAALTASPPTPIRKPICLIQFYTGATTNPYGIRQDLYDDPVGYIEQVFEDCDAAGIQFIGFHNPGGHNSTHYYPARFFDELPNHIRDAIADNLEAWKSEYNVPNVAVYMGAVWGTAQATSSPVKPLMFPDWEEEAVQALLDPWKNAGVDVVIYDAVANRGNDQYSGAIDDQYDTLGGHTNQVSGLVPIGEALPVDDPTTTTAFDTDAAERSEFLMIEELYQDAVADGAGSADYVAVLDGTLPATRLGFHWIFYASEFTKPAALARIRQGYIVGVWDDVSVADMRWLVNKHTGRTRLTPARRSLILSSADPSAPQNVVVHGTQKTRGVYAGKREISTGGLRGAIAGPVAPGVVVDGSAPSFGVAHAGGRAGVRTGSPRRVRRHWVAVHGARAAGDVPGRV